MSMIRCLLAALLCGACGRTEPQAEVPVAPSPPASAVAPLAIEFTAPAEVDEATSVTLTGALVGPQSAQKASFEWKQIGGPNAVLATPYAASTIFVAPEAVAGYELRFALSVERGAETARGELAVKVRADDDPPTAELHAPEHAECGERVVVTGQGRTLEPQRLRFAWRQIGDGNRVTLDEAGGSQASFIAPEITGTRPVWLEFSVSDGVNPPVVARSLIQIDCDGRATSLPPGKTRKLAAQPDVESPLPRGDWRIDGALTLRQTQPDVGAVATLCFEYGPGSAAAIALAKNGERASLRMFGLVRDRPNDPWREPQSSGKRELGEWPADQALGFEFVWDGHELAVHWGPPGARAQWPEPPFPVSFPLGARPKALVVTVTGGEVVLDEPLLTGL